MNLSIQIGKIKIKIVILIALVRIFPAFKQDQKEEY